MYQQGRKGSTQGTCAGLSPTGTGEDPHRIQDFQQCLEWPQHRQAQLPKGHLEYCH